MDRIELKQMRMRQLLYTNFLMLIGVFLFYMVFNTMALSSTHFFFVLGVLLMLQGIVGLVRGDTTKSLFPIYEKVAIYEKKRLGSEWYKERKINYITNIVVSSFMFVQSYWYRGLSGETVQFNLPYLLIFLFILLVFGNIFFLRRFQKIDGPTTDFTGFTSKSNLIAMGIAVSISIILVFVTLVDILL